MIEFRKDGETLWDFAPIKYWDSSGNPEGEGECIKTVRRVGNSLYTEVRVPYEWLRNAVYPVYIDASPIDVSTAATGDDANEVESSGAMTVTADYVNLVAHTAAASRQWGAWWFDNVDIPQSSSVDVVTFSGYGQSSAEDDINGNWHFEKTASPITFTTDNYNITGRGRTTASVPQVENDLGAG